MKNYLAYDDTINTLVAFDDPSRVGGDDLHPNLMNSIHNYFGYQLVAHITLVYWPELA